MKIINVFLMVTATWSQCLGQNIDSKQEMKKLSAWVGHWKGNSSSQMQGKAESAMVDERIEWKVDGQALLINGLGTSPEGKIVHEALGVLSFDSKEKRYRLRTWLRDGRNADAWFKPVSENNFQWGFDIPSGQIRYSIELTERTWTETGEFSNDGSQWYPFFGMQLTRQIE